MYDELKELHNKINEIVEVINGLDIEMRPMTSIEIEQRDNFLKNGGKYDRKDSFK